MLKAKQKLLKWPEVRAGGEAVLQNYGVETLNRDREPLEKKGDVSFVTFAEIVRPSSRRKSMAESLIGPSVSTTIGLLLLGQAYWVFVTLGPLPCDQPRGGCLQFIL